MLGAIAGMIKDQLEDPDEVGLIHFYTEHHNQFHELTHTISALSQDLPVVTSRKCYLDVEAANHQIELLQGLHLVITSLSNNEPQLLQPQQQAQLPASHGAHNEREVQPTRTTTTTNKANKHTTATTATTNATARKSLLTSQNRKSISPVNSQVSTTKVRK